MKSLQIASIAIPVLFMGACNTTKKSVDTSVSDFSAEKPVIAKESPGTFMLTNPAPAIKVPGNDELTAIRETYKEITLDRLKEGHLIYTQGACINCHGAKNIYLYDNAQWKYIIDDMAKMAEITDTQKDAVYKYILAVKATQPK